MRAVVKTGFLRAAAVVLMVALTGCARQQPMQTPVQPTPAPAAAAPATPEQASGGETPQKESEEAIMQIQIGETTFTAVPADTEAAEALMKLLADGPVTIQAENYGGFEKVGSLPQALPQADSRITTRPGDVMLYQGDSIVFSMAPTPGPTPVWPPFRMPPPRNCGRLSAAVKHPSPFPGKNFPAAAAFGAAAAFCCSISHICAKSDRQTGKNFPRPLAPKGGMRYY